MPSILKRLLFATAIGSFALAAGSVSWIPAIIYSPGDPNVDQMITFTDDAVGAGEITWDFGDGSPTQDTLGPSVTHAYRTAGTFTVSATSGPVKTVTVVVRENRRIEYSPPNPRTSQNVSFTAVNFIDTVVRWDFGDGTVVAAGGLTVLHAYNAPGTYTVTARDLGGQSTVPIQVIVQVQAVPSIRFEPPNPRSGQAVVFTAVSFTSSTLIRWDFGDGDIENDTTPPEISHVYAASGVFMVRAYDEAGAQETASITLIVLPPRLLTSSPSDPSVGETFRLTAVNFDSPQIDWDFGDGTPLLMSGASVTHAYTTEGPRTVTATDTSDGQRISVSLNLQIFPSVGARAKFNISLIQLRFEDGKPYTTVAKNTGSLRAFADIKYEGTGILRAQWLLDGSPFGLVALSLSMADQVTIDSGFPPGLPTLVPGLHEISLQILQPDPDFVVPVIRYFVAAGGTMAGTAELTVDRAVDLTGRVLGLTSSTILVPDGQPFLLQGRVHNASGHIWPYLLLRIRLDGKLIDQKLLENLPAGDIRAFETSVINTGTAGKRLILCLYDLTRETPELLFMREIILLNRLGQD